MTYDEATKMHKIELCPLMRGSLTWKLKLLCQWKPV